jgi:serine/threonine protein kinase
VSEAFDQWKATTQEGAGSLSGYDITLSGFEFIRRISSGAFARIYLARRKATEDIVAVKVIKRSLVNYKNQLQKVVLERDILLKLNGPFIVRFCMVYPRQFFSVWR